MAEHTTYSAKTFHRKFEESYGFLKAEDFPPINWADKEQIEMLFPAYRREQLAAAKARIKLNKNVDVVFNLRTPDNSEDLFVNARLVIEAHKRCALFGINGSGKTTLFNAISAGEIREFPKYLHVHHMKELEHNPAADAVSVFDTVLCSHPFRRVLLAMIPHVKSLIEAENGVKSERLDNLKENLAYLEKQFQTVDGGNGEERVKSMLRVLGFDDVGERATLSSLSGGLRMRVALASAFFIDPDILLLDEPTNHLDMPSVLWLENKLRGYKGSYLVVTHDRTLLENVVTSVALIQDNVLEYFSCGFKDFEKQKEKLDEARKIKIDKFLSMNRNLPPDDPMYRTKMQYKAWQQRRTERMVMLQGKFTFKAPEPLSCPDGQQQEGISLINVENVRFSYDPENLPFIFDTPISYNVKMGTRVGIMGPNGAGKSTFLKLITGKLEATEGSITTHPTFVTAYFGQHSTKELQMHMTPLEFMVHSFPDAPVAELKSHLKKTSIGDDPMSTRMQSLSFSQRSCVIFSKLTYVPPHLLIMDEPTNFLDLDSVDSLIMATNKFTGGLIVVTHNRDFLKRCSKHFLSIVPGAFLEFPTMKAAERATYSFISALEEGKAVDFKKAIQQNRGGGAIHTEEMLAANQARLTEQQRLEKEKEDAAKAEADRLAAIAAEKEARRLAKLAAMRTDWAPGEQCWAPVKGKWVQATVMRNIPNMGCTVTLASGKNVMIEAKQLRAENPEAGAGGDAGAQKPKPTPGPGGASQRGGRGGAQRGGAAAGRGRGGGQRGGARGGRR
ncbi:ABC transporter domain-containing protein [Plasmodiophora brassicae]